MEGISGEHVRLQPYVTHKVWLWSLVHNSVTGKLSSVYTQFSAEHNLWLCQGLAPHPDPPTPPTLQPSQTCSIWPGTINMSTCTSSRNLNRMPCLCLIVASLTPKDLMLSCSQHVSNFVRQFCHWIQRWNKKGSGFRANLLQQDVCNPPDLPLLLPYVLQGLSPEPKQWVWTTSQNTLFVYVFIPPGFYQLHFLKCIINSQMLK